MFVADDSLGWVYQFWQSEQKDAVNKSGKKIGADELPAVTQLFTEDYMVLFLLHNTLGAWWAGTAASERRRRRIRGGRAQGRRTARRAPGTISAFCRATTAKWRPAAGTFDGWPKAAKEITVLDPCMGSGHFLVFALPMLVAMRMREEGLSLPQCCRGRSEGQSVRARDRSALHADGGVQSGARGLEAGRAIRRCRRSI